MASSAAQTLPCRRKPLWRGSVLAVLMLVWPVAAWSAGGPVAPCGPGTTIPFPGYAAPPAAHTWRSGDLPAGWVPAPCIGWATGRFTVLTALAGQFSLAGGTEALLLRFGAQSAWRGMTYWSATDGKWAVLIKDAAAVTGASRPQRRGDFTLAELKSGTDLYFLQQDNRSSGPVTYRMQIMAAEPGRLVVTISNVTAVSYSLFTLFDPGDLVSTYIFTRRSAAEWSYYSLSGVHESASVFGNHEASYINRAAAIYRYLAGIPGNSDPPMAP